MSEPRAEGSMLAGAAVVDITPPLPIDVLGYVRRARAPRRVRSPLQARAVVLQSGPTTIALITGDVVGLATPVADRIRDSVGRAVGCPPAHVLLNSSHSHAAPWPGATIKMGGEFDGWTDVELGWWEQVPALYASAAVRAADRLVEARVAGGTGRAPGIAVNRRERTPDGRTILGWNPDGFLDEEVPTVRIDAAPEHRRPRRVATLVGFGCHPVTVGPEVPVVGSDFVGPLRDHLDADLGGGTTLFLQGAAGNVLPLEAFGDDETDDEPMGRRLALEAAHAVADAEPWRSTVDRLAYGSVTPISLYRRRVATEQPAQPLASVRRVVRLPLLAAPTVEALAAELTEREADLRARRAGGAGREVTNPIAYHVTWLERTLAGARAGTLPDALDGEIWAARVGDCAIVGAPGEVFSEIGAAVRAASPAGTTIFAGYCQGVLGYVATPEEYPFGGYEPAVSHRGYGHPAPFDPAVAGIIRETAIDLLDDLFGAHG
jgi:neutral ceramidase